MSGVELTASAGRVALRMSFWRLYALVATVVSIMAMAKGMSFFWIAASRAASARSMGTAFFGAFGQEFLYLIGDEFGTG